MKFFTINICGAIAISATTLALTACGDDSALAKALAQNACDVGSCSSNDRSLTRHESVKLNYYYWVDTVQQEILLHTTGVCRIVAVADYQWDTTAANDNLAYKYMLSNDTLYLNGLGQKVLVRTSGTPGSIDGTWMAVRYYNESGEDVPGESGGLIANIVVTISGTSFDQTGELASSFDFTKSVGLQSAMRFVFDAQDGMYSGNGAESGSPFFYETELYLDMKYEFTVVNRTNTSIEVVRNGRTFLFEILDPKVDNFVRSFTYRLTSDDKSCSFDYENFSITEESCDWKAPEPLVFSNSDGIIYNAEKTNHYEFESCFQKMFE